MAVASPSQPRVTFMLASGRQGPLPETYRHDSTPGRQVTYSSYLAVYLCMYRRPRQVHLQLPRLTHPGL